MTLAVIYKRKPPNVSVAKFSEDAAVFVSWFHFLFKTNSGTTKRVCLFHVNWLLGMHSVFSDRVAQTIKSKSCPSLLRSCVLRSPGTPQCPGMLCVCLLVEQWDSSAYEHNVGCHEQQSWGAELCRAHRHAAHPALSRGAEQQPRPSARGTDSSGAGRTLLGKWHASSGLIFQQKPGLGLGFENLSTTFTPSVCEGTARDPPFLPSGLETRSKPPHAGDVYCHHPQTRSPPPHSHTPLYPPPHPGCAAALTARSTAPPAGRRGRLLRMRGAGRRLGPLGAS